MLRKPINTPTARNTYWYLLTGFVILKLLIHFFTNTIYELHRDEMFYVVFGYHPALGYASNPPLIGFFSWLIVHLGGFSEFWVRFLPALVGSMTIILIGLLVREFGGRNMALIIACVGFLVSPAFLRTNSLYMPVSFDKLFWVLITLLFVRLINTRNPKYWLWIGIITGIAFLNKYSVAFLMAGLILSILLTPHRSLFKSRYFLQGVIIGTAIILPNIIWQYLHNWPVVGHMKELYQTQLIHVSSIGFLMGQILMTLPALPIWVTGLLVFLFAKSLKEYRFIVYSFIIVITLLILGRGKAYYSLGLYPVLLCAGGYVLGEYLRGKLVIVNYLLIALALFIGIIGLPYSLPIFPPEGMDRYCKATLPYIGPGAITWEDGMVHKIPQDYADMVSWKELAELAGKAYNQLNDAERAKCMLYAENYGQASAIQFYGRKYGLPAPLCTTDSYLFWAPDSISEGPLIDINFEEGDLPKLYDSIKEVGRINNPYFREDGVRVYLCTGMKSYFKQFYEDRIGRLKEKYER